MSDDDGFWAFLWYGVILGNRGENGKETALDKRHHDVDITIQARHRKRGLGKEDGVGRLYYYYDDV